MDRHNLAAVVLMASSAAAAAQSGWVTVGEAAYLQLKQQGHRLTIRGNRQVQQSERDAAENLYLLEVPARDIDKIASTLHRRLRHCGGFMLHASEADARKALDAERIRVAPQATRPRYVLANQARVTPLLAQMDEQKLAHTITQLSSFANRYYSSKTGADASDWLNTHWGALSAAHSGIVVTQFSHAGYAQRSVIATIAGSDLAAQVLVLGAHLDSINIRKRSDAAPGADDDASGVAGLTEVLRVLAAGDYRPRRTIKLIAYAAEEVGLRGSQDLARDFRKNAVDVAGVLQLDMINYRGSARDIYLISDYTDKDQNAFLEKLVAAYLPTLTVGRDKCGYACSDHAAWNALGYTASMPFEAQIGEDNPHIHTKLDTYANSGNQAAHGLKFAQLAAAWLVELGTDSP
ncbi:MAG TPA: M20/M25/M40 family metallo-hydrolase [Telluria sp.]|jgi:leucyl aminopeptidase